MLLNFSSNGQSYPLGISMDSVTILSKSVYSIPSENVFHFMVYKPVTYDSTSALLIGIHGSGDNGTHTISRLQSMADRRNCLLVAPSYFGVQSALINWPDTIAGVGVLDATSIIMKEMYDQIKRKEVRDSISTYMIGFSAGGQFVSRYLLTRQLYNDSIPLRMSVSADPYFYTFPTDTFNGVAMPWLCGFLPIQHLVGYSTYVDSIYSFLCNDNALQYYNENYGVLIGTGDTIAFTDGPCGMIQGSNRYERAQTFYAFCDSNAVNRGTTLKWAYAEVPGIGHDENGLYNTKASPTDSSTIAETLLFDTPYHTPINIAPVANFTVDTTLINAGDSVLFTNLSVNANSYFWYFGDSTYSTQVNPYHVYNTAGRYNVAMSAYSTTGCNGWREIRHMVKVIGTVPVTQLFVNNISISVAPNPARESCEVTFNNLFTNAKWSAELYSLDGRKINSLFNDIQIPSTTYKYSLQLKNTAPGIYFIKISCNGGYKTQKLVVY